MGPIPDPHQEPMEGKPVPLKIDKNAKGKKALPKQSVAILHKWLNEHCLSSYPEAEEKKKLAEQTMLSEKQICNWLINARRRNLREILIKKGINPDLLGFTQKGSIKKLKLPTSTEIKKTLMQRNVATESIPLCSGFPGLTALTNMGYNVLIKTSCEERKTLGYVCQPAQSSQTGTVSHPAESSVCKSANLEEEMSRLHILAHLAAQRKEEIDAEASRRQSGLGVLDQQKWSFSDNCVYR